MGPTQGTYQFIFRRSYNPKLTILHSVANAKGPSLPKAEYDFSKSQPWVKTSRNLTFLDETKELMNIYDHDISDDNETESTSAEPEVNKVIPRSIPSGTVEDRHSPVNIQPVFEPSKSNDDDNAGELSSPTKKRRLMGHDSYQTSPISTSPVDFLHSPSDSWHQSLHTGWTPSGNDNLIDSLHFETPLPAIEPSSSHGNHQSFSAVSDSLSRIYLETPVWPLSDREEARLLRYFVENVSRNFDLSDPHRHFRTVVPHRAATCPTLLNAIFALSARHLSRLGEYDPIISNKYQQECLKHLIPMLDDSAAILDENLLASTVILRHIEEIEVPLTGQSPADQQSQLLGLHALIAAQERATVAGGLRQAAFWVGLRQEIYVAFCNQRSIIPALEHCNIDRSLESAPDHVWSCRMVVLCADAIRYCFGDGDPSTATYNWLAESVTHWHNCKPASFTPIYYKEANHDNIFPDIWFLHDDILIGLAHYHIAQILLSAHNPKLPRLGPSRATALRVMDEEIKDHVRILCGMSMSNPDTAPNFT